MNKDLRIIQLIDSLDAGGAERMAVNYANSLVEVISFSALVTTRKEGALKQQLFPEVSYLFLNKQGKIGISAVWKLRTFIKKNKVNILHAHSTSFFTAVLVKLVYPKIKIVWHDHHGNRVHKKGKTNIILKIVSFFFYGILTVNRELEQWAKENLFPKKTHYFPNFITSISNKEVEQTVLKGTEGKRIVFLANLKKPKNHLQIIKAYANSNALALGWSLHLIGKDFFDFYSTELKTFIAENSLQNFVFIYNSCKDVEFILNQSDIGILGSTYEGFPVTLLEYGKARLTVISTNVGYCSSIIQDSINGILFNPKDSLEITLKLNIILENKSIRLEYATVLREEVMQHYSEKVILKQYLEWLR
jgi:glycosyltransferase involved in cell wall biosynthesis